MQWAASSNIPDTQIVSKNPNATKSSKMSTVRTCSLETPDRYLLPSQMLQAHKSAYIESAVALFKGVWGPLHLTLRCHLNPILFTLILNGSPTGI